MDDIACPRVVHLSSEPRNRAPHPVTGFAFFPDNFWNGQNVYEEEPDPLVICELCRIRTADVTTELIMDDKMRNVNLCATCFVRVHKVQPDVVNNDG